MLQTRLLIHEEKALIWRAHTARLISQCLKDDSAFPASCRNVTYPQLGSLLRVI